MMFEVLLVRLKSACICHWVDAMLNGLTGLVSWNGVVSYHGVEYRAREGEGLVDR